MIELLKRKKTLEYRYKELIEEAYNWRQEDSALSDISEYSALKLREELNRLEFLIGNPFSNEN